MSPSPARARATSVTVTYVLTLAVVTALMGGLLVVTGDVVAEQRETATRAELEVLGHRLAAHVMTADRLARLDGRAVLVRSPLPRRVAGSEYAVAVEATGDDARLVLTAERTDVTVRVPFATETPVRNGTIRGGPARVVYRGGNLEVEPA